MARYIDANRLINEFTGNGGVFVYGPKTVAAIVSRINAQPTADVVEVKHGQWMPQIVNDVKAWDCSECKTLGSPHWKRCPICEAKMDGERRDT